MKLRLGRGLCRHHLQPQLDFEDYVFNRTDGTPQNNFKKLGDAATKYVTNQGIHVDRASNIPEKLEEDQIQCVEGLTLNKIKLLTSSSVFKKAKRFEVKLSSTISTQVYPHDNRICGFFRAVKIYNQHITWGRENGGSEPFSLGTINVYCECIFFRKKTILSGKCCKHITGQLRRALYFSSLM